MGTQLLVRALNSSRDLEYFISVGTLSHSFGPIEDAASVPYLSVHGMLRLQLDWFVRISGTSANSKTLFINSGDIPVLTLNILVISFCRFLCCRVVELSLLSSSSKDESKLLYTTRKTLSWSLLMRAFSFGLWKIHLIGQYEKWQITKEFIVSLLCSKFIGDGSLDRALTFWLAFLHKVIICSLKFRLLSILISKSF